MDYSPRNFTPIPETLMDYTLREIIERYGNQAVIIPPEEELPRIRGSRDVVTQFTEIRDSEQETFWVLTLNAAHEVLGKHHLTTGLTDQTLIHPREAFRRAIEDNAVAVAFAHNHPGGSSQPSAQDLTITRRLVDAGELLGIKVLDHVVVARKGWSSAMPD